MLRLADGLDRCGQNVKSVFLYFREPIENGDFEFETLLDRPPARIADYLCLLRKLWQLFRQFRPDTAISFLPLASILGACIGRISGVPQRIVSHRVPTNTVSRAMRTADWLTAWSGGYTGVVAVSKSVARSCATYPKWLRSRIRVIYNGIKGFRASELTKAEARAHLGLPSDGLILAAVGRLSRQKNYPMIIEAISATPPSVKLVIAGEGEDRGAIEKQISALSLDDRLFLLGAIARDDVPHLLRAADIFVQPSLFEGQSNALLEALHAGLPCFVSDPPEQVETVADVRDNGDLRDVAGAILPVDNPSAWATAITEAEKDPELDSKYASAISARAACFTYQRMMQQFSQIT